MNVNSNINTLELDKTGYEKEEINFINQVATCTIEFLLLLIRDHLENVSRYDEGKFKFPTILNKNIIEDFRTYSIVKETDLLGFVFWETESNPPSGKNLSIIFHSFIKENFPLYYTDLEDGNKKNIILPFNEAIINIKKYGIGISHIIENGFIHLIFLNDYYTSIIIINMEKIKVNVDILEDIKNHALKRKLERLND